MSQGVPAKKAESGHLDFLDALRGVAILMVFGFHLLAASFGYEQLPWQGLFPGQPESRSFYLLFPLTYGWAGVAVFFVISGFCIHLNYMRNREQGWAPFFIRRFFRIYPPYLVAVLFFFFFWGWNQQSNATRQLFTHLLCIHNLDERTVFGISPAFWSIGVEVQLYLLYPILLLVASARSWRLAMWLCFVMEGLASVWAAVAGLDWIKAPPTYISFAPFSLWFSWALGAHLADCYLQKKESWLARTGFWVFLVLALASSWFKPLFAFRFMFWALLAAVAVERFMTQKWQIPDQGLRGVIWEHLAALGIVSYSLYLLHQPLMGLTWGIAEQLFPGHEVHPLVRAGLALFWYPVLFLLSWTYYLALEKPSIAAGKTILKKITSKR